MPPEQKSEEGGSPGATAHDLKRIGAMLRAARDARTIIGDLDAASLGRDMVRTRAAVNCFTEIGEAASRLTPGGAGAGRGVSVAADRGHAQQRGSRVLGHRPGCGCQSVPG